MCSGGLFSSDSCVIQALYVEKESGISAQILSLSQGQILALSVVAITDVPTQVCSYSHR